MRSEEQIRQEIEETNLALQELIKEDYPDPYQVGETRGWIHALVWALETQIGGENEDRGRS